jgi:hypothetical protein
MRVLFAVSLLLLAVLGWWLWPATVVPPAAVAETNRPPALAEDGAAGACGRATAADGRGGIRAAV